MAAWVVMATNIIAAKTVDENPFHSRGTRNVALLGLLTHLGSLSVNQERCAKGQAAVNICAAVVMAVQRPHDALQSLRDPLS